MLQGIITAIITPFDQAGNLDEDGLRSNARFQLDHHVNGIVALGTTGEGSTLTEEEKKRIVEIIVEEVDGRVPVIVGTGCNSTQKTIEKTREAAALGADAAMLITPYYNRPTQEGIYRHFQATADATDIPLIVYNHPGRTGQHLDLSTIQRLASIPQVVGLKECSGSLTLLMNIYETVCQKRPDFSLLTGDDPLILPSMALGAHGAISVASNLIPGAFVAMANAASSGDYAAARKIHYTLQGLLRSLFIETNPIPIKAAMGFLGMPSGACRLPLCEMLDSHYRQLVEDLKNNIYLSQPHMLSDAAHSFR